MTVIPLHPSLRRITRNERRSQPTDLAPSLASEPRHVAALDERSARRSLATRRWLEHLFGGVPDALVGGPEAPHGEPGRRAAGPERGLGDVPSPREVLSSLVAMAEGTRRKALVPCVGAPLEVALLRRGANVLVSLYHTEAAPDVIVLDRRVSLRGTLEATIEAIEAWGIEERADARLLERARRVVVTEERDTGLSAIRQRGGVIEEPSEREALAFGFEAAVFPSQELPRDGVSHADVHAMLFGGQLWAWVRGRRIPLVPSGPILLPVQRMVSAVSALVAAWEGDRPLHVRLRSGSFAIGVRRERRDAREVALTIGSETEGAVTLPALAIEDACMPILRVATELLRVLVATDRAQGRNLRITALREEVRRLRRVVRSRTRDVGFTNGDADRLREIATDAERLGAARERGRQAPEAPVGALRFATRWSAIVDGLDATTTFFCGDRLVLSNERRLVALHRDDGQCLWQHVGRAQSAFLAEDAIVRLDVNGLVEIHDLETGELAHAVHLAPRVGGAPNGVFVGGPHLPPTALVAEGRDRLAAIDVRTGELRFRYTARAPGTFRLRRSGRLVLIVNGDGLVDALDVVSGEVLFRYADSGKFCLTPTVHGMLALAVAGEPGRADAVLHAIDLSSGERAYRVELGAPIATAPTMLDRALVLALAGQRRGTLAALDPQTGERAWAISDPGVGSGAGVVSTERAIFVNTPGGRLVALDPASGDVLFARALANPSIDDVPRRLTPLVRGGALFVPSAAVHVLRPSDGEPVGAAAPSELVPDSLHVDERGWMYVAEESGHLAALAPAPTLRLVR